MSNYLDPFPLVDAKDLAFTLQEWFRKLRITFGARLAKSVAGGVAVNLTTEEARHQILEFSGAISANINVIVPALDRQWTIFNNTTGAFTLTVKTPSGTGIAVAQTKRAILYCDSTNVVRVTADT